MDELNPCDVCRNYRLPDDIGGGVSEFMFFKFDLRMAFMIALFWKKVKEKFASPSGIEPLLSG